MGKTFVPGQAPGLHRYEVAQGFQPQPVLIEAKTEDGVFGQVIEVMHGEIPSRTWRAEDIEDGGNATAHSWGLLVTSEPNYGRVAKVLVDIGLRQAEGNDDETDSGVLPSVDRGPSERGSLDGGPSCEAGGLRQSP